ncbi:Predicted oxidoreductase [Flavobacteriaceae bacterium MAR_2010_188]|nr:Predicted oxidoreductase [Flavobacteriaceae bacterium MAR_2010_188]
MKYTTLPNTDIKVSKICLGTMTWGNQNTEKEGHAQMDFALERGINYFDTAEMYPVPAESGTQGKTSEIIGSWFKKSGNRDKVVIGSKIVGGGEYTAHIRESGFSKEGVEDAVNSELKRLQTDFIDLFQLHWPERQTNTFGNRDYKQNVDDKWQDDFNEVLHNLKLMIDAGKIRHIGLSNEKAWGTMRFLEESKHHDLPKMITIQNAYSLLNRTFEGDLAEISHRENIGLLAYSPLAFGVLSGKYIKELDTPKSRLNMFAHFSRYSSEQCRNATNRYLKLAEANELTLAQMSLAFINQQPFVTSNIIGATNLKQLEENIGSIEVELSEKVLIGIEKIHSEIPNPAT